MQRSAAPLCTPQDLIGATLGQRYLIKDLLGVGGMGAVFKAIDQSFDQHAVAIKTILPALLRDPGARRELEARFEREANLTVAIEHENVVRVHDRGRDVGRDLLYLVMEFLEGRNLEQLRADAPHGRMAAPRVVFLLAQVCRALTEVHQRGQLHRDLKPSNLLVVQRTSGEEVVKVLDFGLARPTKALRPDEVLTREGQLLGTVRYIAPEQIYPRADLVLDHRCDIYSLGCVAYHLLAGRAPFESHESEGEWAVLRAHASTPAERLDRIAGVPKPLADAVERAMAKERDARFVTTDAFRCALEAALRTASAPPPAAAPIAPPPDPRSAGAPVLQTPDLSGDAAATRHAAPPGAAARRTGGARLVVGERTGETMRLGGLVAAERPVLLRTASGPALLCEYGGTGSTQIHYQALTPPLLRERPAVPLTLSPRSAHAPAAVEAERGLLLVWEDTRLASRQGDGTPQLYSRLVLLGLNGVPKEESPGQERQLVHSQGMVQAPVLVRAPPVGALLAWHEIVGDRARVRAVLLDGEGTPRKTPVTLGEGAFPALALGPPGGLAAWHARGEHPGVLRVMPLRIADGVELGSASPHTIADGGAAFPALVPAPDGGFAMAFWSADPLPGIKLVRLAEDGTLRGAPILLGSAARLPHRPALIATAQGLVACWIAGAGTGAGTKEKRLLLSYVPAGGRGTPERICVELALDATTGAPAHPALLATSTGLLVAWQEPGRWAPSLSVAQVELDEP